MSQPIPAAFGLTVTEPLAAGGRDRKRACECQRLRAERLRALGLQLHKPQRGRRWSGATSPGTGTRLFLLTEVSGEVSSTWACWNGWGGSWTLGFSPSR